MDYSPADRGTEGPVDRRAILRRKAGGERCATATRIAVRSPSLLRLAEGVRSVLAAVRSPYLRRTAGRRRAVLLQLRSGARDGEVELEDGAKPQRQSVKREVQRQIAIQEC